MVFDIQSIYIMVMSMLPTIANIVTLLVGFKKIFKIVKETEFIKSQYALILKENAKLRKQINELLTKIDHINRKD